GSLTRRDLLQVGACSLLGLSLPGFLARKARAMQPAQGGGRGWGRAKSVIFVFLQGGPPHLDLWDPKPDAPMGIRGPFKKIASNVARLRPADGPMLSAVMLPRAPQESNVVNKGGTAGFLGRAYDPYYLFQDPNVGVTTTDLTLRSEISPQRFKSRADMRKAVSSHMEALDREVASYALNEYYGKAFD